MRRPVVIIVLRAIWATFAASAVVAAAVVRRSRLGRRAERRLRRWSRSPRLTWLTWRRVRLPLAGALAALTLGAVAAAASSGNHAGPRAGADGGVVISSIPPPADPGGPAAITDGVTPSAPASSSAAKPSAPPEITVSASDLAADGIPSTALAAYQRAATAEAGVDAGCHLSWPLLAGIGRVESDHGRFAGAVLHTDGVSTPKIIGIALDGHGTALIRDTDHARLDGDTTYDRAVGPMQFIPSTWAGYGTDGNGDHVADPFNIFDAARSAARYLCAVGADLGTTAGQVRAIHAYNDSDAYVRLVMQVEGDYAHGAGLVVPTAPPAAVALPTGKPALPPANPGSPLGVPSPPHPTATATPSSPTGTTSAYPTPSATDSTTPTPTPTSSDTATATSSATGSTSPTDTATANPSPSTIPATPITP